MRTRRRVTPDELTDLLREDVGDLHRNGAQYQDHWREGRLYLGWLEDTLEKVEHHGLQIDEALIADWSFRRRAVFRLPLTLSSRRRRRADVTLDGGPSGRQIGR